MRLIISSDSKLSEKEEKTICLIINSAEYMGQVTAGLTEAFKKVINPRYVEQISFSVEKNDFEK